MLLNVTCPHCKKINNLHTAPGGYTLPTPGDWSLCSGCVQPGVFINGPTGITVRPPTDDERAEMDADAEYCASVAALRARNTRSGAHPEG